MASLHGDVKVESVTGATISGHVLNVHNTAALAGFFKSAFTVEETDQKNIQEDDEPPRKKQRRESSSAESWRSSLPAAGTAPNIGSITLARIGLDLHFPTTEPSAMSFLPVYQQLSSFPRRVSLDSVAEVFDHGLRLSLSVEKGGKTISSVKMCLSGDALKPCAKHLHMVAILAQRRSIRSKDATAAWSSCLLLPPVEGQRQCFRFEATISWRLGLSVLGMSEKEQQDLRILDAYFPNEGVATRWSPQDFYESVHVPPTDFAVSPAIQSDLLRCQLYPFQARAVDWMLKQENVQLDASGKLEPLSNPRRSSQALAAAAQKAKDAEGRTCYIDRVQGSVVTDRSLIQHWSSFGGLLCEEMGLGKTVEICALICLHRRQMTGPSSMYDYDLGETVSRSKATLIITPPRLMQQWASEISKHAPSLKVRQYDGLPFATKSTCEKDAMLLSDLLSHDIVLTTYTVLSREVHHAVKPPERNLRDRKRRERRVSPLIRISWFRVILDEAQMVESGVSAAALVARTIPRINAWAVTGTPLKKNVNDLHGLLIFLRYEPFCSSTKLWKRLVNSHGDTFRGIIRTIALRHTKDKIRQELSLPKQTRYVITIPFSAIEEQNYMHLFQQMCDHCGLATDGTPIKETWDPDSQRIIDKMRSWLVRLRQTCLHPQVGAANKAALGRGEVPSRTVEQVLEVLIDQNETLVRSEERSLLLTQVLRAHVVANDKSNTKRAESAREIYLQALKHADGIVEQCREQLCEEKRRVCDLEGKPETEVLATSGSDETDDEEQSTEKQGRVGAYKKTLRLALEVQHTCVFFVATSFFQTKSNLDLTSPESEEFHRLETRETEYYDRAKLIRKELLRESHKKAERLMRKIQQHKTLNTFTQLPNLPTLQNAGGIENRKILEKMDILGDVLDEQATQLNAWRAKIVDLLLKPLVDEEEGLETTGNEYEDSTKQQDELYVYIDALKASVSDRTQVVTGLENALIDHEAHYSKKLAEKGEGHAPELTLSTLAIREKLKPKPEDGSLRGLLTEVRAMETALEWQEGGSSKRANAELSIVQQHLKVLQQASNIQARSTTGLEKELDLFRLTMNLRLAFYARLQQISDTVAPHKEELDEELDRKALDDAERKETELTAKLGKLKTDHRFLCHLRLESTTEEIQKMCVICQSTFVNGVLTVCGHQYCKECIGHWWSSHQTCPVCKKHLRKNDFHPITYKPRTLRAREENQSTTNSSSSPESVFPSTQLSIYSDMNSAIMREIQSIDIDGSFGIKIDTLARHLLWLRQHDPGSKSVIFSQYRDFLQVLFDAFKRMKIGVANIVNEGSISKFRNDPSIECLLLDAKTDSSGLNLVNATHVFLCEPLINPAIELQAIARVHRIGQQRPTTVYMYLVSDTVEEAIYEISVARRLAHMERGRTSHHSEKSRSTTPALQESVIEAANSLEMQQVPLSKLLTQGKTGGEVVDKNDLWRCLFDKVPRKTSYVASENVEREVGRHLRAEAAEERRV